MDKRFTKISDGYYAVGNEDCFEDQDENYCGPAIDCLADYENTGIKPDDIVSLQIAHKAVMRSNEKWADECFKYRELGTVEELVALVNAARWIPITERQPKSEDAVSGMIEVWGEYGPDTMSVDFYWEYETKVTHWRKLPADPNTMEDNHE